MLAETREIDLSQTPTIIWACTRGCWEIHLRLRLSPLWVMFGPRCKCQCLRMMITMGMASLPAPLVSHHNCEMSCPSRMKTRAHQSSSSGCSVLHWRITCGRFCAACRHGSWIGRASSKRNIAMLALNWRGQPWMSDHKLVSINCSSQQHQAFLCQSFCSLGGWAQLAPIVFGFVSEPLANNLITVRFFSTAQSCGFICW